MGIIITHPGSAHLDDFLSCCLVMHQHKEIDEIRRREPSRAEILDPNIWVLDVGDTLDPERKCYDHHQIGKEDSTLSLLLKDWGLWEKATKVFRWLKVIVMMDTQGPKAVMRLLNINSFTLGSLDSFLERALLQFFEEEEVINGRSVLFSLMREIGKFFLTSIREFFKFQKKVGSKMEFKKIKGVLVAKYLGDLKPSKHISRILKAKKREVWPEEQGGILVYPNSRIPGTIALKRYEDDERVDFTRIRDYAEVRFAHEQGFFISVNPMSDTELERYISDAIQMV